MLADYSANSQRYRNSTAIQIICEHVINKLRKTENGGNMEREREKKKLIK